MTDLEPPPNDPQKDLARRAGAPAISPWLIVGLIVLVGAGVYVASALLG
jgi:hypothetical protein